MTFHYRTIPYRETSIGSVDRVKHMPGDSQKTITRKFKKDRRKSKRDRRQSVREGVIVELSSENNRRKIKDRRKNKYQ
ncbi:MAG: hypothetical protein KAR45_04000 [Desulfobacteraceae bacterium]|nr:hypothetical protein [Desulfobacteraceae bacterium]